MRKVLFLLLVWTLAVQIQAQKFYIPYRVGNQFGLVDNSGKLIVEPQFDVLELNYGDNDFWQGYKYKNANAFSTLIYKGKIILENQEYGDYHINNSLIKAGKYVLTPNNTRYDWEDDFYTRYNLFTYSGKKLFAEDQTDILESFHEFEKISTETDDLLIGSFDTNDRFTLQLYNRKSEKFTRTILSKVKFEKRFGAADRTVSIIYDTNDGKRKQIDIQQDKKTFKVISENEIEPKSDEYGKMLGMENKDRGMWGGEAVPPQRRSKEEYSPQEGETVKKSIREAKYKGRKYFLPKKNSELYFSEKRFDGWEYYHFSVFKDGKQGLKLYNRGEVTEVLPTIYDEIFWGDWDNWLQGYVLKTGDKYALIVRNARPGGQIPDITTEAAFDLFPMAVRMNYGQQGFVLIKLFDEKGNFVCYADQTGKKYYSE
ncbi:MAG: hypothetical protein WBF83_08735 [Moheibacter sp.]